MHSKSLFKLASEPLCVPKLRSNSLFEITVSATLYSVTLDSVPLRSVHVYAQVHTSIYIHMLRPDEGTGSFALAKDSPVSPGPVPTLPDICMLFVFF